MISLACAETGLIKREHHALTIDFGMYQYVALKVAVLTHRMLLMFLALGFAVTADAADDLGQVLHVR